MRLLLVAEPSVTRDATADFFRQHGNFSSVDVQSSWESIARRIEKGYPDTVVIDIRQKEYDGFALVRRYRELDRKAVVILLMDNDLPYYRDLVTECGATAFVLRDSIAAELIRLLTVIQQHGGGTAITKEPPASPRSH